MAELFKVTAVGDKELLAKLRALGPAGSKAARKVLYRKAEVIAGKAKDEVPVDFGALKSTIHATLPETDANGKTSVSIVAGGPAKSATRDGKMYVGYAVVVHEDMTARHPVGGPKFIERPFLEEVPKVAPEILRELDKAAKGK